MPGGSVKFFKWRQACVDALKSNFNPHVIDNFWSPNRSYYRITAIPNMNNATPPRLAMTPEQYGAKNLAHDGIISRSLQYPSLMNSRYFVTHAFSSTAFARSDGAAEGVTYRSNNSASQHVGSYQGSIKMFIKLTQDAGSISKRGVPCGILAVHSKSKLNTATEDCPFADDPDFSSTYAANKYHEGSQMYLYINTMGKLRLTRLCYAFTFHTAIEGGNTVIKKYGSVDKDEKDPGRSYPRKDIEVDVSTWKAYEWHYINIYWNDNTGVLAIEIDGQDTANNNVFDDPDNYGILDTRASHPEKSTK